MEMHWVPGEPGFPFQGCYELWKNEQYPGKSGPAVKAAAIGKKSDKPVGHPLSQHADSYRKQTLFKVFTTGFQEDPSASLNIIFHSVSHYLFISLGPFAVPTKLPGSEETWPHCISD